MTWALGLRFGLVLSLAVSQMAQSDSFRCVATYRDLKPGRGGSASTVAVGGFIVVAAVSGVILWRVSHVEAARAYFGDNNMNKAEVQPVLVPPNPVSAQSKSFVVFNAIDSRSMSALRLLLEEMSVDELREELSSVVVAILALPMPERREFLSAVLKFVPQGNDWLSRPARSGRTPIEEAAFLQDTESYRTLRNFGLKAP